MKKYIKDLTENEVIHAPTKEIAEKLCNKFHELGLTWMNGRTYKERTAFGNYKKETCYCPAYGESSELQYYKSEDFTIYTIDDLLDFQLKIEAGKFYKMRNGNKARIYATDSGGDYPVHGAVHGVIFGNDKWYMESWKCSGIQDAYTENERDIVSEWEEEPTSELKESLTELSKMIEKIINKL